MYKERKETTHGEIGEEKRTSVTLQKIIAENDMKYNFTIPQELVDEVVVEFNTLWIHSPAYFSLCKQNRNDSTTISTSGFF